MDTVKVIKTNGGVRLVRTVAETAVVMPNRKRDDQGSEREGQQQPEGGAPTQEAAHPQRGFAAAGSGCRDRRVLFC